VDNLYFNPLMYVAYCFIQARNRTHALGKGARGSSREKIN
jgi:hypothetical protein